MSRSRPRNQPYRTGLVTIVVPAKDEAAAIAQTIRALPVSTLEAEGFEVEVIVLDGNSTDGTAEIAQRLGAIVIPDPAPGKGSAFRAARTAFHGDYVIMLDADGSYAADAIPRVVALLAWGEADVVMGDRHPLPGAMNRVHRLGNAMLTLEAAILYGRPCHDLCTGLWGFRADVLEDLPLHSRGFELEADLFAMTARRHCRVAHTPVDYLPRQGETKLSATRDGLRIGWWLIRSRVARLRPPRPARAAVDADPPHVPQDSSSTQTAKHRGHPATLAHVTGIASPGESDDRR